jgi:hypothetical protein
MKCQMSHKLIFELFNAYRAFFTLYFLQSVSTHNFSCFLIAKQKPFFSVNSVPRPAIRKIFDFPPEQPDFSSLLD